MTWPKNIKIFFFHTLAFFALLCYNGNVQLNQGKSGRTKARTKEDGAVKNRVCLKEKKTMKKAGKTCGGLFTRKKSLSAFDCMEK